MPTRGRWLFFRATTQRGADVPHPGRMFFFFYPNDMGIFVGKKIDGFYYYLIFVIITLERTIHSKVARRLIIPATLGGFWDFLERHRRVADDLVVVLLCRPG